VGNLHKAATDTIEGYYPVVQKKTKAVIANLRVRLSLSPVLETEDENRCRETSLTAKRPPRVTLRSKAANRGQRPAVDAEPATNRRDESLEPSQISVSHSHPARRTNGEPGRPRQGQLPPQVMTRSQLAGTALQLAGTAPQLTGTAPQLTGTDPRSAGTAPHLPELKRNVRVTFGSDSDSLEPQIFRSLHSRQEFTGTLLCL
jgi:hypothetical protein